MIRESVIPSLLKNTTQSYKCLWALALLNLAKENPNTNSMSIADITAYSTIYALELINTYKIRLSANRDSVFEKISNINFQDTKHKDRLDKYHKLFTVDERLRLENKFKEYVLYRFQSPFIQISGTDHEKHKNLKACIDISGSESRYDTDLIYKYDCDRRELLINKEWLVYLRDNYVLLNSFFTYEFSNYLHKYNISIPSLLHKVDPTTIQTREQLTSKRKVWDNYISESIVTDIFDNERLHSISGSHLDHFIPWSYVSHNLLWNLTPINQIINIKKSDKIICNEMYFEKFATQQYELYSWLHDNNQNKNIEEYRLVSLDGLSRKDFITAHSQIISDNANTAIRQGFTKITNLNELR